MFEFDWFRCFRTSVCASVLKVALNSAFNFVNSLPGMFCNDYGFLGYPDCSALRPASGSTIIFCGSD